MADVNAADLPEGSIVATRDDVWIKREPSTNDSTPWDSTGSKWCIDDRTIDRLISGAGGVVLRHGYGEGQP